MSAPIDRRAWLGNLAVAGLLSVIALLLLAWQRGSLGWSDPGPVRVAAAVLVVVAYAGAWGAGWSLRRRRQRAAQVSVGPRASVAKSVLVAWASQTGVAEQVARQTAESLAMAGVVVETRPFGELDAAQLAGVRRALFVVSTTGEGDAPDMAADFERHLVEARLDLAHLHYGVLALGDREYVNFCAFGHRVERWLQDAGATPLFDLVEVDDGDEGALRHWQHHLGQLAGRSDLPDWSSPNYATWRLVERRLANPGSAGAPCFALGLKPDDPAQLHWRAGDIAEIGPCHAAAVIDAWLAASGLDGEVQLGDHGSVRSLRDVLARSVLPAPADVSGQSIHAVVERLVPLPHREYSIASVPADGVLELLLRQMRGSDGRLGLGSGWLTEWAPLGARVALRIRANTNFHAPDDARPLILVGNGTGIAGLRALLRERISRGHRRNWLVFGERHAEHDYYWRDEIETWQRKGDIERLDAVFSRDGAAREYVQHRLAARADELRAWVAEGASIHVCGSLEGMAPGVDAILRATLGADAVQGMLASGRYRRDVY
ncbi:sulfite reductase flavoprotein subunit alpha [Dokdonella sp.]|uniref:sulfite reductase subunit alpha n=1 Tax=Dokdonella sp. TaxID=2291710 RepID=UPI0025C6928D|nr:sulfite reductase flavoprotein subunit alpha [Dokdonella sp.]